MNTPNLKPALAALHDAAGRQPQSPADLVRILETLAGPAEPSLLTAVTELLDHLTETLGRIPGLTGGAQGDALCHLKSAAEALSIAADQVNLARHAAEVNR